MLCRLAFYRSLGRVPRQDLTVYRAAYALPWLRGARTPPLCHEVEQTQGPFQSAMTARSPDQSCQSTRDQGCQAEPGCDVESSRPEVAG